MVHALIVDDDPVIRFLTARILERAGYSVSECATGDEALERLVADGTDGGLAEVPDVVVSDVAMPGGTDGIALVRSLAHLLPALPVILMSGSADALDAACRSTRPAGVLEKPYCAVALLDLVRAAVG